MEHIEVEFLEETHVFYHNFNKNEMMNDSHIMKKGAMGAFRVVWESCLLMTVIDDWGIICGLPKDRLKITRENVVGHDKKTN